MPQLLERPAESTRRAQRPIGARNALIEGHIKLVRHIVRRIARRLPPSVDVEDLVAAGCEGLLRAAERFDEDRGVAFSTFAGCSIRGAILDALREMDPLARPTRQRANRLDEVTSRLAWQYGSSVPTDVLVRESGLSRREVDDVRRVRQAASLVSLDDERTEGSLGRVLEDPTCVDAIGRVLLAEAVEIVREEIEHLLPNDRRVVLMYYVDGMLFREIAERLSVTEGRISQIHKRAVSRLRDAARRRGLI